MERILFLYYGVIQVVGFITMGIDKKRAREKKWRIPEARLWLLAWIGAGLGLWGGMVTFRHKTKHLNFRVGFPFFTCLHLVILYFLLAHLGRLH